MTTLQIRSAMPTLKNILLLLLLGSTPFIMMYLGAELQYLLPTMGLLDPSIWQLLLLSILSFLGLSALTWWLLQRAWVSLGLPKIQSMVLQFNKLDLPKGNPWCAVFVSWVFKEAGFTKPRTAWSPGLFPTAKLTLSPKPADVLGIYSVKLKRIAHCGLVERRQNNWIISIEGNTNIHGSREGDGVYRKWRHVRTISKFADWAK